MNHFIKFWITFALVLFLPAGIWSGIWLLALAVSLTLFALNTAILYTLGCLLFRIPPEQAFSITLHQSN